SRSRQRNLLHAHALASAPVLDERYKAEDLAELQRSMRGKIVTFRDDEYHKARQLFNYAFQDFPLFIAYCQVFSDVKECLDFARKFGVQFALRSGGHSTAGYSVCSGMVIDLSRMQYAVVDAPGRTVTVGPGTSFAHLNAELKHFDLHVPGGVCQSVCVAGFMQ